MLPWKAKALFKPVPATVALFRTVARPHGDRRPSPDIGRRATGRAVRRAGNRGITMGGIAALETAPLDAATVEPLVTAAPKAERRSSSSRRAGRDHSRRFAGGAPQRARSYRREEPSTPRHNLLLSLGGVYSGAFEQP